MNNIELTVEYPPLEISTEKWLKEQLVSFYFQLTRTQSIPYLETLSKQYSNILDTIKNKCPDEWIQKKYLYYFFILIAQTRDIVDGKGEHDISYMMIWNLYQYYPLMAVFMIDSMVNSAHGCYPTYGSWRDIKYVCQYVRRQSPKGQDDPLIELCIIIMNNQLKKDLHTWKYTKKAFSKEHISNVAKWIPRENKKFDWLYEKLVIRWTENQFPALLNTPHTVDTSRFSDSYNKALSKAKRLYRKTIALLNKGLETTEIKLCSNTTIDIIPKNVSKITMIKQPRLIFEKDCSGNFQKWFKEKNKENSQSKYDDIIMGCFDFSTQPSRGRIYDKNILKKDWYKPNNNILRPDDSRSSSSVTNKEMIPNPDEADLLQRFQNWHSLQPFSYFVEKGISLARQHKQYIDSQTTMEPNLSTSTTTSTSTSTSPPTQQPRAASKLDFEIDLLNSQWRELVHHLSSNTGTKTIANILPIVDISYPMQHPDKESYYTAIGMAMFIAEKSSFGRRILALDNQPLWINLETTTQFVHMIQKFEMETQSFQNSYCNYIEGVDFVVDSLSKTKMKRNFINDIELVIFSNFYTNFHTQEGERQNIPDLYKNMCLSFSKIIDRRSYPRVVFWNLNKNNMGVIPNEGTILHQVLQNGTNAHNCSANLFDNPRVRFFSGFSPSLMRVFYDTKKMTAYESVCHILNSNRYDYLRIFLHKCENMIIHECPLATVHTSED